MKDPDRLVHRASDELVLSMLHAARKEAPHSAAKQRTVMAFAAGASVLGISGSAAAIASGAGAAKAGGGAAVASASAGLAVGAGPATGTIGSAVLAGSGATSSVTGTTALLVAKWVGIGAVSGVLTAGTANELTRPSPAPVVETSAPASARETPRLAGTAASPIAPKPAELEAGRLTLPSEPAPVRRFESAPPARADDSRALAREVASIDGAREALRTKDPDRALAELSRYERTFPSGSLAPEALYLQLEALLARKDQAAARRVAEKLLRAHPQSPQAARARAVLARSNP